MQDEARPIIPDRMYFKIGEVSKITAVKSYVIRYWETEFDVLSPQKSKAKQRVYEKKDIECIFLIKKLLWRERYSIEGARQKIKEIKKGIRQEKIALAKTPESQRIKQIKYELKDLIGLLKGTD